MSWRAVLEPPYTLGLSLACHLTKDMLLPRLSASNEVPAVVQSGSNRVQSYLSSVPSVPAPQALRRPGEEEGAPDSARHPVSLEAMGGPGSLRTARGILDSNGFTDVSLDESPGSPAKSAHAFPRHGLNLPPSTGAATARPPRVHATGKD